MKLMLFSFVFLLSACSSSHSLSNETSKYTGRDIVKLHPLFREPYMCSEHWDGQFKHVGDALGADCIIQAWYEDDERLFMRPFKNKGLKNEDWFGWHRKVLSPCDCEVVAVHINPKTNMPGIMTPGKASSIRFKRADDIEVIVAHIDDPRVEVGDVVMAGAWVALVGNNGYSRNPHIHIASWFEDKPLQIRFDQKNIKSGRH